MNLPDDVSANHAAFGFSNGPECKGCFAQITDENPRKDVPEYALAAFRYKPTNIPSEYRTWLGSRESEGCAECVNSLVKDIALEWVMRDSLEDAAALIAEYLELDLPRKTAVLA